MASSNGIANGASPVSPSKPVFPAGAATREYAASLDAADPLKDVRGKFIVPSKANISCKKLAKPGKIVLSTMFPSA